MRLAFSTLACPSWSLEAAFGAAATYGYDGIELRLIDGELIDPTMGAPARRRVTQAARDTGVPIAAVDSSIRVASDAEPSTIANDMAAFVDLAAEWGAPTLRVFGGDLPEERESRNDRLERAAALLDAESERSVGSGVTVAVETHDGFSSSANVAELLSLCESPRVGAVWDSHHPHRVGETPADVFANLGPRLALAQVKDAVRDGSEPSGWRLTLLGEGEVPVCEIVETLVEHRYDGWLSVEWEKKWHPGIEDPDVALPQHIALLKQWLGDDDR